MAITTVRSTYALDVETVRVLDRIAHRWGVSKSEALRRAIRGAEAQKPPAADDALRALDRLPRALPPPGRSRGPRGRCSPPPGRRKPGRRGRGGSAGHRRRAARRAADDSSRHG